MNTNTRVTTAIGVLRCGMRQGLIDLRNSMTGGTMVSLMTIPVMLIVVFFRAPGQKTHSRFTQSGLG